MFTTFKNEVHAAWHQSKRLCSRPFKVTTTLIDIATALSLMAGYQYLHSDPYNSMPSPGTPSITMGGYQEVYTPFLSKNDWLVQDQIEYVRDKVELDAAIADCVNGLPSCNPQIKAFADMLTQAGKVSDKLVQAEIVNASINLIPYDNIEAQQNLPHHSLKEALVLNLAVCDESARLKLYALERLGFSENDIRWVIEEQYINNKDSDISHAITEVRINGQNWVMNLWSPAVSNDPSQGPIDSDAAAQITIDGSKMETAAAELNVSGKSFWSSSNISFVPIGEFNSTEASYYNYFDSHYNPAVPPAAINAVETTTSLNDQILLEPDVIKAVKFAFSVRYTIVDDTPSNIVNDTPQNTTTAVSSSQSSDINDMSSVAGEILRVKQFEQMTSSPPNPQMASPLRTANPSG